MFVGGLHRSGTTPFAALLANHPDVSGLTGTNVHENEGQHLQTVYPAAMVYGGSGHFARDHRAHLTEASPLATPRSAAQLLEAWRPYWDLSRPVLVEKSPPNLIMGRFLQAMFPTAAFIMVVRHPVTVALSTKKWTRLLSKRPWRFASLSALVEHWLIAHRLMLADLPFLQRALVVHYEDLVNHPGRELLRVRQFLELRTPLEAGLSASHNVTYERRWAKLRSRPRPGAWQRRVIERRYGPQIAEFGYDVHDLTRHFLSGEESLQLKGSDVPGSDLP